MPSRSPTLVVLAALAVPLVGAAQAPPPPARLLEPARVYDGAAMHEGWGVIVRGRTIEAAGPLATLTPPAGAERVALPGLTLLPGLVEGHSHVLLHPYDEAPWDDQVLKEPLCCGSAEPRTTWCADVCSPASPPWPRPRHRGGRLRRRRACATRSRRGSSRARPAGRHPRHRRHPLVRARRLRPRMGRSPRGPRRPTARPSGALSAIRSAGAPTSSRSTPTTAGGPNGEARPTFSVEEIAAIVAVAKSGGRYVAAHAARPRGCDGRCWAASRRSTTATPARPRSGQLMKEKGVTLLPDARGGRRHGAVPPAGRRAPDPEPARLAAASAADLPGRR